MAKQDKNPTPKTSREFVSLANKTPGITVTEASRHTKIEKKTEDGRIVTYVPRHAGDLPNGTRHSIEKSFRLMGILKLLILALAAAPILYKLQTIIETISNAFGG